MDYNTLGVILLTFVLFLIFIWYETSYVYVTSRVDGKKYKVRNNSVSQESADILSEINIRLQKLKAHLDVIVPKPEYLTRLDKYDPGSISENILNMDTSYTLNKKDMYFCLSTRTGEARMYDINTLMFVAIHEYSHVSSKSVGHTKEFTENFMDLLTHSVKIGIYDYVNYAKTPVEYCGIKIENNVI